MGKVAVNQTDSFCKVYIEMIKRIGPNRPQYFKLNFHHVLGCWQGLPGNTRGGDSVAEWLRFKSSILPLAGFVSR